MELIFETVIVSSLDMNPSKKFCSIGQCPPQHPLARKGCERGIPLGRLRYRRHAGGADEMNVLAMPASCDAPEEELRA